MLKVYSLSSQILWHIIVFPMSTSQYTICLCENFPFTFQTYDLSPCFFILYISCVIVGDAANFMLFLSSAIYRVHHTSVHRTYTEIWAKKKVSCEVFNLIRDLLMRINLMNIFFIADFVNDSVTNIVERQRENNYFVYMFVHRVH